MKENKTIGWIGLGNMGKPMANRLIEAGFPMVIYNRTIQKANDLEAKGARVVNTPADVAAESDIIFTMISTSQVLQEITFGENGILQTVSQGQIMIDMSTVSPESSSQVADALAEKGVRFLRAPVTGSTTFAEAGTLGILVSGEQSAQQEVQEYFEVLGKNIFNLGSGEEARYMKLALNIMIGATCQIMGEALTLSKKAGIEWNKALEVIRNSAVGSPFVNYKVKPLSERNFSPMFSVSLMEKDLDLALKVGSELAVSMPTASLVRQLLASARATGKGDLDLTALVILSEEMSGIE